MLNCVNDSQKSGMVRACNVMGLYSLLFQRGHLFVVFLWDILKQIQPRESGKWRKSHPTA